MRSYAPATLLLLAACKGCNKEEPLPEIVVPVEATAVGVRVADAVGPAPLAVPVFAVNILGAVVTADGVDVTSTAALDSETPTTDSLGWGEVTLSSAEPGTYAINATLDGAPDTATAWVVGGTLSSFGASAAVAPGVAAAAVAGGGLVWSVNGALWWAPASGGAPVQVLSVTDTIISLLPVQLDNDGVMDLLVVSGDYACLLRGRSAGGLTWVAGWAAASGTIAGADVSDLDGDAVNDVAIAVVSGQTTDVVWLIGDGTNTFTYADHVQVGYEVWGLSTEDLDSNGDGEVSLLSSDGLVRRYAHFEGEWSSAGGGEFDLNLGPGARLHPSVDLDGDGLEDLVVSGPDMDAAGSQAYIVSTPDRTIFKMFPGSEADPLPASLHGTVADLDGDGTPDLVLATDRELKRTEWNPERVNFDLYTYSDVPGGSPIAIGDVDGDHYQDVVRAGVDVTTYLGAPTGNDWGVKPAGGQSIDLRLAAAPWMGDLDGNAIVDLVGFVTGGAGLKLAAWVGDAASEAFVSRGEVVLGLDSAPVALAVCGNTAYALVTDAGASLLWRVDVDPAAGVSGPDWGIEVVGTVLGCGGTLDGIGDVVVLVGGEAGVDAVTVDGGTPSVVAVGSEPVGAIGMADPEGDGSAALVSCPAAGCSILVADLDGDGRDDVAASGGNGVDITTATALTTVAGGGVLTAADADGDGTMDLLASRDGLLQVVRAPPGGVTPASARFLATTGVGPIFEGDLDGDGRGDLFWAGGREGAPDGTLLYVRASD